MYHAWSLGSFSTAWHRHHQRFGMGLRDLTGTDKTYLYRVGCKVCRSHALLALARRALLTSLTTVLGKEPILNNVHVFHPLLPQALMVGINKVY